MPSFEFPGARANLSAGARKAQQQDESEFEPDIRAYLLVLYPLVQFVCGRLHFRGLQPQVYSKWECAVELDRLGGIDLAAPTSWPEGLFPTVIFRPQWVSQDLRGLSLMEETHH